MPKAKSLKRMTAMELARFADDELRIHETHVWRLHGGPLPKQVLISTIEETLAKFAAQQAGTA